MNFGDGAWHSLESARFSSFPSTHPVWYLPDMKVAKSPSSDSAKGLGEEPFSVMPHEHGSGGRRVKKCAGAGGKVSGKARRVSAMRDQYALAWPLDEALANRLARLFIRMFKADSARLTAPLGKTIFLISGVQRRAGHCAVGELGMEPVCADPHHAERGVYAGQHYGGFRRAEGLTWVAGRAII